MKTSEEINELVKSLFDKGEFKTIKPVSGSWMLDRSQYIFSTISNKKEPYNVYASPRCATVFMLLVDFKASKCLSELNFPNTGIEQLGTVCIYNNIFRICNTTHGNFDWFIFENEDETILYVVELHNSFLPKVENDEFVSK